MKLSTCTKVNSKTDKMSLVGGPAKSPRRPASHVLRVWSVRKQTMLDVCNHSSGRGGGGGNTGEFPEKRSPTRELSQSSRYETISGLINTHDKPCTNHVL
jgi:hypothetical protein